MLSTRGRSQAAHSLAPRLTVLLPLLDRLMALELCFSAVSFGFSSPLPGFCFNLSVAEMQNTQRAYFYQRFPILHLEPGDWPPRVASLVCGASRAVWQMLLLRCSCRWLFLPEHPFPGLPQAVGRLLPTGPVAGLQQKTRQIRAMFGYLGTLYLRNPYPLQSAALGRPRLTAAVAVGVSARGVGAVHAVVCMYVHLQANAAFVCSFTKH